MTQSVSQAWIWQWMMEMTQICYLSTYYLPTAYLDPDNEERGKQIQL